MSEPNNVQKDKETQIPDAKDTRELPENEELTETEQGKISGGAHMW